MAYPFVIWNQANDGKTMGIRVRDVDVLVQLPDACRGSDIAGNWNSLEEYLNEAATALQPPIPYVRLVDIVWLNTKPFGEARLAQDRRFRVTYTGNVRTSGGFASQGYSIVEPEGAAQLLPLHQTSIQVEYLAGAGRDAIVVLPS